MIQQLAQVDDDVMDRLGVDMRNISPRSSATFQITVGDMGDYTYFYDEFKIGWRSPKDGGWYYDMFDHPLKGDVTEADIDRFPLPDPLDPARFVGLRETASGCGTRSSAPSSSATSPPASSSCSPGCAATSDAYADWGSGSPVARRLMDRVLQMQLAYWEKALAEVGDVIDVAQIADDVAGQQGLLISPRSYRKLLKPLHKELCDFIHARTDAKIFMHSCGAIRAILPDLIEIGVDIINPVQVSAAGMDSAELKAEFGKEITFWGGGVDTQGVFGTGTPQRGARRMCRRRVTISCPAAASSSTPSTTSRATCPPRTSWPCGRRCGSVGCTGSRQVDKETSRQVNEETRKQEETGDEGAVVFGGDKPVAKTTIKQLLELKGQRKLALTTAFDHDAARACELGGIDIIVTWPQHNENTDELRIVLDQVRKGAPNTLMAWASRVTRPTSARPTRCGAPGRRSRPAWTSSIRPAWSTANSRRWRANGSPSWATSATSRRTTPGSAARVGSARPRLRRCRCTRTRWPSRRWAPLRWRWNACRRGSPKRSPGV